MTEPVVSYHDRRLARRLEDPEFRAEYERQRREMADTHVLKARIPYPDHGIVRGDRLIVRQQSTAEQGDLVVALVEGGATICPYEAGLRVLGRVVEVARTIA